MDRRERGGTGRRAGFRSRSRKRWEFESPRSHDVTRRYEPGVTTSIDTAMRLDNRPTAMPVAGSEGAMCVRRTWSSVSVRSVCRLHPFEYCHHLRVHEIDGLQGSNHDSELDDASLVVATDDVDSIDILALDGGLEL